MVRELRHPVLLHKLSRIRDLSTPRGELLALLRSIGGLMVYEILSDLGTEEKEIEIWLGKESFPFVDEGTVVFVSVLRAGLPMLEGALSVLPSAGVGFLAMKRDEESLEPHLYYSKLPELGNRRVVVLDPMLATGGTLVKALEEITSRSPR